MLRKLVKAVKNPQIIYNVIAWQGALRGVPLYNRFHPRPPLPPSGDLPELNEIYERMKLDTDISDHLPFLFAVGVRQQPRLMVELGVRGGDSTFVLERVARLCNSPLISVDIDDCSSVTNWDGWRFNQCDDVLFAARFGEYCTSEGLPSSEIDFLFLDTSHLYDHTVQELAAWMPLLSERGCLVLHDTNQHRTVRRQGGRYMLSIENPGVITAVQEYLGCKLDTSQDFCAATGNWLITHRALSNGFTVIQKLEFAKHAKRQAG